MINKIMDAIGMRLHSLYGDGYEIYKNEIEQGLQEPCFLIVLVDYENKPLLNRRSIRKIPFDIHYFPKVDQAECISVLDTLMDNMDVIKTVDGDSFRGTKKAEARIEDGVLHFFINYDYIAYQKEEELEPMETISMKNEVES